jgi:sphingolipid delta-4 desaturase
VAGITRLLVKDCPQGWWAVAPPQYELDMQSLDFRHSEGVNEHFQRRRDILQAHPEVRHLIAKSPWTAAWVFALGAAQFVIAAYVAQAPWWVMLLVAYFVGAVINHALYVLMHECVHDTPFEKQSWNRVLGICCDFALSFPSAMAFRTYHLMHHKYLGQYERDPDIVHDAEGKLIGNAWWRKAIWLGFLSISQALRPWKVKKLIGKPVGDRWMLANLLVQIAVDIAVIYFFGWVALLYLGLSSFFALGLHPMGGRWIQEHYSVDSPQDTHSYYGPLNKLCFNMGYHVEHHDFANVPWNNLPKLKKIAGEFYDDRFYYRSWIAVVLTFIFNPRMSAYARVTHDRSAPHQRPMSESRTAAAPAAAE